MVQENSITYRTLKRQIEGDIARGQVDYAYRLNMINTFEGRRITTLEAEELRLMIEPYKTEVE